MILDPHLHWHNIYVAISWVQLCFRFGQCQFVTGIAIAICIIGDGRCRLIADRADVHALCTNGSCLYRNISAANMIAFRFQRIHFITNSIRVNVFVCWCVRHCVVCHTRAREFQYMCSCLRLCANESVYDDVMNNVCGVRCAKWIRLLRFTSLPLMANGFFVEISCYRPSTDQCARQWKLQHFDSQKSNENASKLDETKQKSRKNPKKIKKEIKIIQQNNLNAIKYLCTAQNTIDASRNAFSIWVVRSVDSH